MAGVPLRKIEPALTDGQFNYIAQSTKRYILEGLKNHFERSVSDPSEQTDVWVAVRPHYIESVRKYLYRNPANAQGQVVKYSPGNQIDIEAQIGDPWLFLVDRLTSKIPKSLRSAFNDMRICHEGSAHYKKKSVYGRLTIQLDLFYYANADPEKWLRHADGRLSAVQAVGPDMLLSEFRT